MIESLGSLVVSGSNRIPRSHRDSIYFAVLISGYCLHLADVEGTEDPVVQEILELCQNVSLNIIITVLES